MLGCNDTVTVWNRVKENGKETFLKTVIPVMCKWNNKNGAAQTTGSKTTYPISVIIPLCDKYLPESEWLKSSDKSGFFTVRKGDLIALGAIDTEITGEKPNTMSAVKELLKPECAEIKAYTDNTRLRLGKHIKAEGA